MPKYKNLPHTHTALDVISLVTAKLQCQFDAPADPHEDDPLITLYINSGVSHAEAKIESAIKEVKIQILASSFEDVLNFKKARLKSVDAFQYRQKTDGELQAFTSDDYEVVSVDDFQQVIEYTEGIEFPELYEASDAVQVSATYGYDEIPEDIINAILLFVKDMHDNKADRPKEKLSAADKLLAPYRYYPIVE